MARVLIVSSAFPPHSSAGGAIRLVKFLKHLLPIGWKCVVLTQDRPERTGLSGFLLDELPTDLDVLRVPAARRSSRQASDDSMLSWGARAFWKGWHELRRMRVDLVHGVAPPFTNALVAMLLAWLVRKPLVLDFKDDWVDSPDFLQKGRIRRLVERRLERWIIRYASAVIHVTPQSLQAYRERYADLGEPEKFHLVPNGCDLDEYAVLAGRRREIASERFLIVSAAWGYRKEYRDIGPFFLALDAFFKRRPDARGKLEVVLLGDSLSGEYEPLLQSLGLDGSVHRVGAVKREELVEWLWKADLHLLVQPVGNTTAISGTLYEYWATGKAPILLISERGASSALVDENRLGRHFGFNHIEEISAYLEWVFDGYERNAPPWIGQDGVLAYDRKELVRHLDAIWKNTIFA